MPRQLAFATFRRLSQFHFMFEFAGAAEQQYQRRNGHQDDQKGEFVELPVFMFARVAVESVEGVEFGADEEDHHRCQKDDQRLPPVQQTLTE
ncbi:MULTISPECIES: hypothetical protein [Pacificimonas]|uniref:Uncharacterized protein n=1 Tax=Pacificimonas aurantium TaxID=1250540 RepID=A0ABS7WJR4_9SPHN|nr:MULTISPECIES: hypothetical protein [Pacificimonas]MBZ6378638.1 hypothetical protein [Pacificimonas aurantium]